MNDSAYYLIPAGSFLRMPAHTRLDAYRTAIRCGLFANLASIVKETARRHAAELREYRQELPLLLRRRQWARDARAERMAKAAVPPGPCTYCGEPDARTVDHVVARAVGGTHDPTNLTRACRKCNSSKGKASVGDWLASGRPQSLIARAHLRQMPGQLALLVPVGGATG